MNPQSETWYRTGSDMIVRVGFSLVMCGTLAVAIYATHYGASQQQAASRIVPQIATVVASYEDSPGVSKAQAVIDASPAPSLLPATIPVPIARVAQARPVAAKHAVPSTRKIGREPTEATPEVVRFQSCLPGCETQDPLIVGRDAPSPQLPAVSREDDRPVETASLGEPRPNILGLALDAPRAVYQTGRHALTSLVETAF